MLEIKKKVEITGESKIEEKTVEVYTCKINSENPEELTYVNTIIPTERDTYKRNRAKCREDRTAFEEAMYAIQDGMITEMEG